MVLVEVKIKHYILAIKHGFSLLLSTDDDFSVCFDGAMRDRVFILLLSFTADVCPHKGEREVEKERERERETERNRFYTICHVYIGYSTSNLKASGTAEFLRNFCNTFRKQSGDLYITRLLAKLNQ